MNKDEINKALINALMYGEGVLSIDPLKLYKKPPVWKRLVSWIKNQLS